MKKQLTKEQKIDLIWNYDEIELIANSFLFIMEQLTKRTEY